MSKINLPIALLSLVTSSLLWASVYNSLHKKPETKDLPVPLQYSNLNRHKYAITDMPSMVNVPIVGTIDQTKIAAFAIANLSQATAGIKPYPVTIFPSQLRDQVIGSVTTQIRCEDVTSKGLVIKVTFTGSQPPDNRGVEPFPSRVFITGPTSAVSKVASVQIQVDFAALSQNPNGLDVTAKAMDAAGFEVTKVILQATDIHPEYTDEALREPLTIHVRIKPDSPPVDTNAATNFAFPQ